MLLRDVVSARRPLSTLVKLHTETKRERSRKVLPENMDKVANRLLPTSSNNMEVWMHHQLVSKQQYAHNEEIEGYHNLNNDYDNDE